MKQVPFMGEEEERNTLRTCYIEAINTTLAVRAVTTKILCRASREEELWKYDIGNI